MKKPVGEIKLTKKEKGFIKDIARGESKRQAVLNNYNIKNKDGTAPMADAIMKRPHVIKKLLSIADSLPNELLIEKHLALLNKEEVITKNNMSTGKVDVIPTGQIDTQAVKAGLDMAYKLKGLFSDNTLNLNVNVNDETRKELTNEMKAYLHGKNK